MSQYFAKVVWQRAGDDFIGNQYSRGHEWHFDGGLVVPASASPQIVPLPHSVAANVDPEEAFVAAVSSCHMLFFLSVAAKRKIQVENYTDIAEALMEKNAAGKLFVSKVFLRPAIEFSGERIPNQNQVDKIHHIAHESCFIANSIIGDVIVEAPMPDSVFG